MQRNSALWKIVVGVTITVVGGLLLAFFRDQLWPSRETPEIPQSNHETQLSGRFEIRYDIAGRYVILGPNPEGVWASSSGASLEDQYVWQHMEIHVRNECGSAVYLDSEDFRLYYSTSSSTDDALTYYSPTRQGMEYQSNRIPNGWLNPEEEASGALYFHVPAHQLPDGTSVRSVYSIVRYLGSADCPAQHDPY